MSDNDTKDSTAGNVWSILSQEMVQVPAELLASLIATVEQLKETVRKLTHDVDQLQRINVFTTAKLQALEARENNMPGFFRFPLLPVEIRQMIVSRRFHLL